jgi:hypothetical protein
MQQHKKPQRMCFCEGWSGLSEAAGASAAESEESTEGM